MADRRIERLADVLVNYSVAIQPGDKVLIQGDAPAAALILAVYEQALRAGGHPLVMPILPGMDEILYRVASEAQLQHVSEPMKLIAETYDAHIRIAADLNTKELSGVDPQKMVVERRAQAGLMKTHMQRAAAGELRWVLTLFPTHAYAQDAEMSLGEYEDFVYGACLVDQDDAVGAWQRFSAWQQRIVDGFAGKRQVHVVADETDLRLSIAGRVFINSDGHHNMPCGEVFTGPVEDSVEGRIKFSFPVIIQGREVSGVRLWFERGRVVRATAEKNEDFLLKMLDTDEGARRVGEFAIGTNAGIRQFTRQILFDEKIGGTLHMALGAGYPETGSRNESSIHWDMICDLRDGGRITVDDELIYQDGAFLPAF